jgi:hypothetical protein
MPAKARHRAVTQVAHLQHDPRNARKHGERNHRAILSSLAEVGAARSIVIDEAGVVLAGNATLDAAKAAGLTKLHVVDSDGQTLVAVRRAGLNDQQKARLALADNRAAELAEGWDLDMLRELRDDGIDLEGLWDRDELDALLAREQPAAFTPGTADEQGPTRPEGQGQVSKVRP